MQLSGQVTVVKSLTALTPSCCQIYRLASHNDYIGSSFVMMRRHLPSLGAFICCPEIPVNSGWQSSLLHVQ